MGGDRRCDRVARARNGRSRLPRAGAPLPSRAAPRGARAQLRSPGRGRRVSRSGEAAGRPVAASPRRTRPPLDERDRVERARAKAPEFARHRASSTRVQEAQRRAANQAHRERKRARPAEVAVLAEHRVEPPVEEVLDRPVSAVQPEHPSGVGSGGREARDQEDDLVGRLPLAHDLARDAADPGEARPVREVALEARGGRDRSLLEPTVSLFGRRCTAVALATATCLIGGNEADRMPVRSPRRGSSGSSSRRRGSRPRTR